jgi:exopolysaccharide production protein ExoQ
MDLSASMPSRFVTAALYALIAVAVWSPGGVDVNASPIWELLRYVFFISLSAAIIGHTLLRHGLPLSGAPEWVLLAAFLLYTSLSALWSEGGMDAFIKACLIFSAMLVSICLAYELGLESLLRVFFNALTVFVLISIFVVFVFPERGVQTGWLLEGDWRGIAGQKNGLGGVSSLVFVAACTLPVVRRRNMLLAYGQRVTIIGLSLLTLVNSGSRGALLMAIVGLAMVGAAFLPRVVQRVGLVTLAVAVIPAVIFAAATLQLNGDKIDVLGTTIDSNGRVTLWTYGLTQLLEREFLGFGVGGFWTPGRIIAFKDVNGWVLDNFHNGYVTILVEGGLVGISLLLLMLASLFLLYFVAIGQLRDSYVALAFAYACMFVAVNFTENEIGRSTSLTLIMFLTVTFALRPHILRRLAARGGDEPVPLRPRQRFLEDMVVQ